MPFRYEGLVREPRQMIGRAYRLVGMECPPAGASLVHGASSGKGKDVKLSADIGQLCRELLERLDVVYAKAWTPDRVALHGGR